MEDRLKNKKIERIRALMQLDRESKYRKFRNKSCLEHLEKNKDKQVDFLSAAVLVCDVKEPVTIPSLKIRDGALAVPPEEFIKNRPDLTVDQLASIEYGGAGNVALPAAALGINVGVMGYVGRDPEYGFFVSGMRDHGVNTFGIIQKPDYRTDVSFIPLGESGCRAPITFCEDAGKHFDMNDAEVKEKLILLNPKIVQISYSGLFEEGADKNDGIRLWYSLKWIKQTLDSLIMVDTHTYTTEPERYDCLKAGLQLADMFVCSDDEVELIVPRYGISTASKKSKRNAFLDYLRDNYGKKGGARLYAVTSPEKTYVLYCKPNGTVRKPVIENWFTTTKEEGPIFDTTGAGDSWRAGLNAYILNNIDEFRSGKLNIEHAVQMANLTARLYISGKRVEAFKQYKYDSLMSCIQPGKPITEVRSLDGLYKAIDGIVELK